MLTEEERKERARKAALARYYKNREAILANKKAYRAENRERHKIEERKYRAKNRDKINARRRANYANNPTKREKHCQEHREWREKNYAANLHKMRHRYENMRIQALTKLGGKCARCGFADSRALQVDHINGGGFHEKKKVGQYMIHKTIIEQPLDVISQTYQVLCANCNWIKKKENNENVKFKRTI